MKDIENITLSCVCIACQPLIICDKNTINRGENQIKYGLTVESFLKRDEERSVNDIYVCTYNDGQDWYFDSAIDESRRAYIFETLSTPHGSATLSGEQLAGDLYTALDGVVEFIETSEDKTGLLAHAKATVQASLLQMSDEEMDKTPVRLRSQIKNMQKMLVAACSGVVEDWEKFMTDAQLCLESCIRRSIEMRCVAVVTRDMWPFSRS